MASGLGHASAETRGLEAGRRVEDRPRARSVFRGAPGRRRGGRRKHTVVLSGSPTFDRVLLTYGDVGGAWLVLPAEEVQKLAVRPAVLLEDCRPGWFGESESIGPYKRFEIDPAAPPMPEHPTASGSTTGCSPPPRFRATCAGIRHARCRGRVDAGGGPRRPARHGRRAGRQEHAQVQARRVSRGGVYRVDLGGRHPISREPVRPGVQRLVRRHGRPACDSSWKRASSSPGSRPAGAGAPRASSWRRAGGITSWESKRGDAHALRRRPGPLLGQSTALVWSGARDFAIGGNPN